MPLFDSHCHLDFSQFEPDRSLTLAHARQVGVAKILLPAVTAQRWPQLLAFSQSAGLYCALGLHPYWLTQHQLSSLHQLEKHLANRPETLVAVGECGLDAVVAPEQMPFQLALLERQIQISIEFDLPLILHVRKAHAELQKLLKKYPKARGVIHGFSGSYELAMSYIQLGMKLGIGGTITYPRALKTRSAVTRLPLESIVLETDAPDMPLCGHQGQRNSPIHLPLVLACLTSLRGESPEQIEQVIWTNTMALFALSR